MKQEEIDSKVKLLFYRNQYATLAILDDMIRALEYVKSIVKNPSKFESIEYAHSTVVEVARTINAIFNNYTFK